MAATSRSVTLWLPYWQMDKAYASAVQNSAVVGSASPFWYAMRADNTIRAHSGAGSATVINGLHSRGIKVVPTVTEEADLSQFTAMVESPTRRAAHVRALVALAKSRSYDGLDLDYEKFAVNPQHNSALADRAGRGFTTLVQETCRALHALHKSCVVTVMARTSDAHVYWRGRFSTWSYDWRALSAVVDRVRIMAYAEHGKLESAGPIASIAWVKQIIAYARQTMPAGKVVLGLPAYGYDWSSAGVKSVTSRAALALAKAHGITPRWNSTAQEYTFSYVASGVRHTVWFEERVANHGRAALARSANFAGIALWAAGGEDPGVWPRLRALYTS